MPPRLRPLVPAVAVILAELAGRVASAVVGFYPRPGGSMVISAEGAPRWILAVTPALARALARPVAVDGLWRFRGLGEVERQLASAEDVF